MKTKGIFIFIALVLALGGVILLLFPHEPRYQGRSLSSWLQQCYDTPLMETQRFQESKPPEGIVVGSFVAAEISLGIDPFFYCEGLYKLSGMPPLIYSWKINSIARQTAPFVESREPSGQKVMKRDEKKLGYKVVSKTDAWKDDNGNAEYVLSCTRLDTPSKFEITQQKPINL